MKRIQHRILCTGVSCLLILLNVVVSVMAQEYDARFEQLLRGNNSADNMEFRLYAKVNDSNVMIRTEPSFTTSKILGKVRKDTQVVVLGKSSFIDTKGKTSARWLQIEWQDTVGWIYGVSIDLREKDLGGLPVIVMTEEEFSGKKYGVEVKNMREDFPMQFLELTDFDEMIARYHSEARDDTPIIGKVMDNFYSNKFSTLVVDWVCFFCGGYDYLQKYWATPHVWTATYKGYIILMLLDNYLRKNEQKKLYFLVDYKVIPNPSSKYQIADIYSDAIVFVNGSHRRERPEIIFLMGSAPLKYRSERREDVYKSYIIDIGTKKIVEIKKDLTYAYVLESGE